MKKKIIVGTLLLTDVLLINLSFFLSFYIRFDGNFYGENIGNYFNTYSDNIFYITIIKIIIFVVFGLYKNLWKYASIEEAFQIGIITFVANASIVTFMMMTQQGLPRGIYLIAFILDTILIGATRLSYRTLRSILKRFLFRKKHVKKVLVIGAGRAGATVIKELRRKNSLMSKAVAIIDDDPSKLNSRINGIPVVGNRKDIVKIVQLKQIDEIIIAIPSTYKKDIKEIVEICSQTKCKLQIVPSLYELIDGEVTINQIRAVNIEDLLGRDPVKLDLQEINSYIKGKTVLVTGGGGSIGSELCRQIVTFNPEKLLLLDIYENNAYDIQQELIRSFPTLDLEVIIASIRDKQRLEEIFERYQPDVVFHAAAHKHVPLMEANPQEAIKNNIFGTENVAECAHKYGARRFVLISTDKAVNPTNIMGATKRVAEMIIQSLNEISDTEFVAVRFGNVLGSNGSVVPLFKKQITEGGPVTVTDAKVTRYFMTIPEAVQLVIQAGSMAKGGEIFVLDMGEPVKIIELAKNLIRLSGFEPDVDIPIEIVGLRPGEKLYEELLLAEEGLSDTKHDKIFIGSPIIKDFQNLNKELEMLNSILDKDLNSIKEHMVNIVPTYKKTG
ncbi:FlaA1/EpsC-like NDP-sugar epimerase [Natranaerovirga hydrolytica]|uniref:FlaA1/EpsC-like NDP-sugar epimerase n=1 Tax=Natranaerovirga hydrolytica TaxID=680378 RepID=A0A4R1MK70_9FIRM|nr:nucleoside-diphosphate sugar epimerase/dehydratase [Natranaerovirga hydrolytica]TCK93126.1 FlaA1/EpsC-like NDP-sugar epimerase [Natranaerovirga hydrolytica]